MTIHTLCKQANGQWPHIVQVTLLNKNAIRSFRSLCMLKQKDVDHDSSSNINDEKFASNLQWIKQVCDLRDPGQFFIHARAMKRHFIFHAGPTNSGKTHHALKAFLRADSAIYCGPLRMLAGEIYRKSNAQNVPCDMITGEEKLWAVSSEEPSNHIACTVELCSTIRNFDVAVIDEVQMLRCHDRAWAWTCALLGVPAEEVHLCGEASAIGIVTKLLSKTNDTLEVKMYDRITPLKILNKSAGGIEKIKIGDCVVSFSQKDIYSFRTSIERKTRLKCAVVYGNLPSNIRFQQAEKYNNGKCDVLVASDAIGMGLNLNINRIIFSVLQKFDGDSMKDLTPHHVKQIAGRAGRYKSKYETGFVTSLEDHSLRKLKKMFKAPIKNIRKAGILPSFVQLQALSSALPGKDLSQLLDIFEMLMQLDNNYFLCDIRKMKMVSMEIQKIPFTLYESHTFAIAPMNIINNIFVRHVMKLFAWHVYRKEVVTEDVVKDIIKWPPNTDPRTLSELQHLENIHEVFDLYRWLSYRFEDIFVATESIIVLQEELEEIISRAVDSNLKGYKKYQRKKRKCQ